MSETGRIQYLIGVDGGGTGTRVRVATRDGRVLASGEAGPSALASGSEQAWKSISLAIEHARLAGGLGTIEPSACAIGLGLAGAHVADRCRAFRRCAPPFARVVLETDSFAALVGAHANRPGALVVAGTGSVGEALRRDGTRISVGGYGFPSDDEGSGAWLGLGAIREAQRALDGIAPVGPLVKAIGRTTGPSRESMLDWCAAAGQNAYAGLAPIVFENEESDPCAQQLITGALIRLQELAIALDPHGDLPLVMHGSIGQRLQPRLIASLRARCVTPAGDAIDGALHMIGAAIAQECPDT